MTFAPLLVVVLAQTPDGLTYLEQAPKVPSDIQSAYARCKEDDTAAMAFQEKIQKASTEMMMAASKNPRPRPGAMSREDGQLMQELMKAGASRDSSWHEKMLHSREAAEAQLSALGERRSAAEAACPMVTKGEVTAPAEGCMKAARESWKRGVEAALVAHLQQAQGDYKDALDKMKLWATNLRAMSAKAAKSKNGMVSSQALGLEAQILTGATELATESSSECTLVAHAYKATQDSNE